MRPTLSTRRRVVAAIGGACASTALLTIAQHEGIVLASAGNMLVAALCGAAGASALVDVTHRGADRVDQIQHAFWRPQKHLSQWGFLAIGIGSMTALPAAQSQIVAQKPACAVSFQELGGANGPSATDGETLSVTGDADLKIDIAASESLAGLLFELRSTGFGPERALTDPIRLDDDNEAEASIIVGGIAKLRGRNRVVVEVSPICRTEATITVDGHVWGSWRGIGSLLALAFGTALVAAAARPRQLDRWQARTDLLRLRVLDPTTSAPISTWTIGSDVLLEVSLDPAGRSAWFETVDLDVTIGGWGFDVDDRVAMLDVDGFAVTRIVATGGPSRLVIDLHADGHLIQALRLDPHVTRTRDGTRSIGRVNASTIFEQGSPDRLPSTIAEPLDQSISLHAGPAGHPFVLECRQLCRTDNQLTVESTLLSEAEVSTLRRQRLALLAVLNEYFSRSAFPEPDGADHALGRLIELGSSMCSTLTVQRTMGDVRQRRIAVNEERDTLDIFTMPWAALHDGPSAPGIDGFWGFSHDLGSPLGWVEWRRPAPPRVAEDGSLVIVEDHNEQSLLIDVHGLEISRLHPSELANTPAVRPDPAIVYTSIPPNSSPDDEERFTIDPTDLAFGSQSLDRRQITDLAASGAWQSGPIVVLNGFRCGADAPEFSRQAIPELCRAGAAAIIATELDTTGELSELFGRRLIEELADGATVASALRTARNDLWLSHANPIGLVHRLHGSTDLVRPVRVMVG